MRPPKPLKPEGLETPGVKWRPRAAGWSAYWIARADKVALGWPIETRLMWPPSGMTSWREPMLDEWKAIASDAIELQDEMLTYQPGVRGTDDALALFNGTFGSLVDVYLSDKDSPYQDLRGDAHKTYRTYCDALIREVGDNKIADLTFRDFKNWHETFRLPAAPGEPERISRAHYMMNLVRGIVGFGKLLKLPLCKGLKEDLSEMEFEMPAPRDKVVTAAQSIAIRAEAHRQEVHSVALAQALQFELGIRQRDAIGHWIGIDEPGLSDIVDHCEKWLFGVRWDEVDDKFVLRHRLSKSVKGRQAVARPQSGKIESFPLTAYPMVMEELALIPADKRVGPMVVAEHSGLPWRQAAFARNWRWVADAAGVPKDVQNRDNRAGATTEGINSGAHLEDVQRQAAHADVKTTKEIYDRSAIQARERVAHLRVVGRGTS